MVLQNVSARNRQLSDLRIGDAVIGDNIELLRLIGGEWRAATDETENYSYAIAL